MKRLWSFALAVVALAAVGIWLILLAQPGDSTEAPVVRRTPHGVMLRAEPFLRDDQEGAEALTEELLKAGLTQAQIDRIRAEITRAEPDSG